ncbi:MAG: hypothetical protein ACTSRL_22735 [Candidatus Helarchaeota archaeon]
MTQGGLPRVQLRQYVQRIRNVFDLHDVVNDEEIDYLRIEQIPIEMNRRREIALYFIPEVFGQSRYRMDLVDGMIYYLEVKAKTGYHPLILQYWSARAGVKIAYDLKDVERGGYGYSSYHPIWSILGWSKGAELVPTLVKLANTYRDKKRRLSVHDYSLYLSKSMSSSTPLKITPDLVKVYECLHKAINQRPLADALRVRQLLSEEFGVRKAATLLTKFNKLTPRFQPTYERSAIGLPTYYFQIPYPHFIYFRSNQGQEIQTFLHGGRIHLQEIALPIPFENGWQHLMNKLPPEAQCFRATALRCPNAPILAYFDSNRQQWNFPWEQVRQQIQTLLEMEPEKTTPIHPSFPSLRPTKELVQLMNLLELDFQVPNSRLARRIWKRDPKGREKVQKMRIRLDTAALVYFRIYLGGLGFNDWTYIELPGNAQWQFTLLSHLLYHFGLGGLFLMENLVTTQQFFRLLLLLPPEVAIRFIKWFVSLVSPYDLEYRIYKTPLIYRFKANWYEVFYDPANESWQWDVNDYEVRRLLTRL